MRTIDIIEIVKGKFEMLCELLICGNKSFSCEEVNAEESAMEVQRWLEVPTKVVLAAQAGEEPVRSF